MPIYKLEISRTTAEEAVLYVAADSAEDAKAYAYEDDLHSAVDAYSNWDFEEVGSDDATINAVSEVAEVPESYEIPDELDFRTKKDGSKPEYIDPRQTKLPL